MNALSGRRALVTGGASGIGAACSRALLGAGAEVMVCGRSEGRLRAFTEEAGGQAHVLDVTDEAAVDAAFREVGPIDILIANAGAAETAPLKRTSSALFRRMVDVNLLGTFLTLRAFLGGRTPDDYGRAVVVASTASLKGYAFSSAYVAAKHGALGLVRSAALEVARTKTTVNAVCPGFTRTAIATEAAANIAQKTGRSEEDALSELTRFNPQGRLVEPSEVAAAVLGLLGQGAGSINGQAVAVDGGETA